MAKTKRKRDKTAPKAKDSMANLEDTLVSVSTDVAKVARDYRVPIIVGVVVVVAVIGVFGLNQAYRNKQLKDLNTLVHEFFSERTDDEIRAGYEQFLADMKDTVVERFAIGEVANWLTEQDKPDDRAKALSLVREGLSRYQDDAFLGVREGQLEAAKADDESFTIPPSKKPDESAGVEAGPLPGLPTTQPPTGFGPTPPPSVPTGGNGVAGNDDAGEVDDKPTEGGDAKPTEGGDAKPTEGGDAKPTEGGDAKPTEDRPAEKPEDDKSGDGKADAKPAEKPADPKPDDDKAAEKPDDDKSDDDKPAGGSPTPDDGNR